MKWKAWIAPADSTGKNKKADRRGWNAHITESRRTRKAGLYFVGGPAGHPLHQGHQKCTGVKDASIIKESGSSIPLQAGEDGRRG